MRISIVGEDRPLGQFLKRGLEADGYEVQCAGIAATGPPAAATPARGDPDLAIPARGDPDLAISNLAIQNLAIPGLTVPQPSGPKSVLSVVPNLLSLDPIMPDHRFADQALPDLAFRGLKNPDLIILDFAAGDRSEDDDAASFPGSRAEARQGAAGSGEGMSPGHLRSMLELLRSIDGRVPVLALTSVSNAAERADLLEAGADDCLSRPLSLRELRARCRALLRRRAPPGLLLRCGGVELDRMRHTVARDGEAVALTRREFALLEYLMIHRGYCVSRAALLAELWNGHPAGDTNVVDVYINYLRRKLGGVRGAAVIQTVRGQGYSMGGTAGQTAGGAVAGTAGSYEFGRRDSRRLPGPADA